MSRPWFQRGLWLAVWLAAAAFLLAGIHPTRPGEPEATGLRALAHGVLAGRDTLTHDYPAAWWGWSQIKSSGNLPLWNPSWFCGEPFIASQTFMPFYPLNWLSGLLPFPLAFNVQYPLHLILAAAVMAWCCRRRGLGWLAAGLVGLSWGFGGHLATLTGPGHIQKLQALAWLPLVALGAGRLACGRGREGIIPFGLGLALQVTAGHLQIVYLSLIAGGLEALAIVLGRLWTAWRKRQGLGLYRTLGRPAALGALALALALGLSAVFWIPTTEFAKLSNRQGALSWEDATRGSLPPEEKFEFLLPRLKGDSMPYGRGLEWTGDKPAAAYTGRYGESSTSSPERIVSDYVGAGVLVFALLGLFCDRRRRGAALGYLLLAVAILLLSQGKYRPGLYAWALAKIPGLAHFRSPSAMLALLAYGLTMAAGIGLNGFLKPTSARPQRRGRVLLGWGALMLLLALAAVLVMIRAEGQLLALREHMTTLTGEAQLKAAAGEFLRAAAVRHLTKGLFLVLTLAGLWVLLERMPAAMPRKRLTGRLLLTLLALVWGYDLLTNARPFWNAEDVRPYQQFLTSHWAMPLWSRSDEPVRYLEVGNELSNRALTLSDFKQHRLIGSASGYHPVAYEKYYELSGRLGFYNPNFLRLFAVNYLVWPEASKEPWPEGFLEYKRGEGKILLRNPDNVYVRPVTHLRTVRDWKDLLNRLATPGFNAYESTMFLESDVKPERRGKQGSPADMHLQTRIFPLGPGETRLRCQSLKAGTIIVSEPAVPGWRVWINGTFMPHQPKRADGYFLSLYLLAGKSDILLVYDPVSQRLGLYVTLLALGALAFLKGRRKAKANEYLR